MRINDRVLTCHANGCIFCKFQFFNCTVKYFQILKKVKRYEMERIEKVKSRNLNGNGNKRNS